MKTCGAVLPPPWWMSMEQWETSNPCLCVLEDGHLGGCRCAHMVTKP